MKKYKISKIFSDNQDIPQITILEKWIFQPSMRFENISLPKILDKQVALIFVHKLRLRAIFQNNPSGFFYYTKFSQKNF